MGLVTVPPPGLYQSQATAVPLNALLNAVARLQTIDETFVAGDPTGVVDSTAAIAGAMIGVSRLVMPPGVYRVNGGLSIPAGVTLELARGAQLLLSQSIVMNNSKSALIGSASGLAALPDDGDTVTAHLKWVGAANGKIIQVGTSLVAGRSPIDVRISGIDVDAAGVSGVTGFLFGITGVGVAFSVFDRLVAYGCAVGIDVPDGCEQNFWRHIFLRNPVVGANNTNVGIRVGNVAGGGNTTLWFQGGSIEGYGIAVKIGDSSLGGAGGGNFLDFSDLVMEAEQMTHPLQGLVQINSACVATFHDCYLESSIGNPANSGQRGFVIGSALANDVPYQVTLRGNRIGGFPVAIEGLAWDGLIAVENDIDITGHSGAAAFKNTGGGRQQAGVWRNNVRMTNNQVELSGDTTGFDFFRFTNADASGTTRRPFDRLPTWQIVLAVNGDIGQVALNAFHGIVTIIDNFNVMARFAVMGTQPSSATHHVFKLDDPSSLFSVTQGNAGTFNLYWDAGNSQFSLETQNGARTFNVLLEQMLS